MLSQNRIKISTVSKGGGYQTVAKISTPGYLLNPFTPLIDKSVKYLPTGECKHTALEINVNKTTCSGDETR